MAGRPHRSRLVLAAILVTVATTARPGALAVFSSSQGVSANTFTTASCLHAEVNGVQQGTAQSLANGTTTVTISSVDPTKSFLGFSVRSNSNRPVGSVVRGRIASATSLEFARATNEAPVSTIDIQWYVVEYSCGVTVQRGQTTLATTTVNVPITPVVAVGQAFVTWSKTPDPADQGWDGNDPIVGELTTTSNLQFRADAAGATHTIWWQVVEYTSSADVRVQKGSTSLLGAALSTTATLPAAVDVTHSFVLVGLRSTGSGADVGARLVRAQLTNSTTLTLDRSISGSPDDVDEVAWQVVELKEGSRVQRGNASFATGVSQATAALAPVNTTRTVALASTQGGGGTSQGRSPYAGDDIVGVAQATLALTSPTQLTLTRANTADAADIAWYTVEFAAP